MEWKKIFSCALSIYWGAYISGSTYGTGFGNAPWDKNTWNTFESHAGKSISILHWGEAWHWTGQSGYCINNDCNWQKFFPGDFQSVRDRGVIPLIDWSSADLTTSPYTNQPAYSLANIAAGTYDTYVQTWASAAATWKNPLFLRFDWEMNGNWYPWSEQTNGNSAGQYVAAWKHVHDIFTNVGAKNVTWVWCPNIISSTTTSLSELYPGDAYVDWVCLDGYNKGTSSQSWSTLISPSYQAITQITNKPLLIGETASNEFSSGQKAMWITDALGTQIPQNFPQIKGVLWFNWNSDAGSSYVIESSTASQNAFAAAIGSSYYVGSNQFATPSALSKIAMIGDVNDDNLVNSSDLKLILGKWLQKLSGPYDQFPDGIINSFDFQTTKNSF